jgi:hypothetical protein
MFTPAGHTHFYPQETWFKSVTWTYHVRKFVTSVRREPQIGIAESWIGIIVQEHHTKDLVVAEGLTSICANALSGLVSPFS